MQSAQWNNEIAATTRGGIRREDNDIAAMAMNETTLNEYLSNNFMTEM